MARELGDRAAFFVVYIREAHPEDGWRSPANEREGIRLKQPRSEPERREAASTCVTRLKIDIPTLIDGMDDKVEKAYSAWPDRIYVVGKDGRIAYRGGPGPRGFRPAEARRALEKLLEAGGPSR